MRWFPLLLGIVCFVDLVAVLYTRLLGSERLFLPSADDRCYYDEFVDCSSTHESIKGELGL